MRVIKRAGGSGAREIVIVLDDRAQEGEPAARCVAGVWEEGLADQSGGWLRVIEVGKQDQGGSTEPLGRELSSLQGRHQALEVR